MLRSTTRVLLLACVWQQENRIRAAPEGGRRPASDVVLTAPQADALEISLTWRPTCRLRVPVYVNPFIRKCLLSTTLIDRIARLPID